MSSTKRSFIKAGAILSIVASVFAILSSVGIFMASFLVDKEFVIDTYREEAEFSLTTNEDGSYFIQYKDFGDLESSEDDVIITVEGAEVDTIAMVAKVILIVMSLLMLGISVAEFIISLLLLSQLNKEKASTGLLITLLVLSALSGNFLSMAFMIVALAIKNKPKVTLENIEEVAKDNQ